MTLRAWHLVALLAATSLCTFAGCGGGETDGVQPPVDNLGGSSGAAGSSNAGTAGTTSGGSSGSSGSGPAILPGASNGSPIATTPDDSVLLVANRDVGTVSVFKVAYAAGQAPAVTKSTEVPVGGEPWQIAVHPDGKQAFVVSRLEQKLVRIANLGDAPMVTGSANVGSEPTAVALSPTGATAYVANWNDGTVSVIDTASMGVMSTIDLNAPLAAKGYFGADVQGRPALAHPRSIVVTNNGDPSDIDEAILVTEFFAQQKDPVAADGSNADTSKVGVVYRIPAGGGAPYVLELPPLADMGFKDLNGNVAGCFPNQLGAITVKEIFGYVLSTCASPEGPVGTFTGPAFGSCADDSKCPGAVAGSCVSGKCKTNCTTNDQCGANGGVCSKNVCQANPANVKTTVATVATVLDLGAVAKCAMGGDCKAPVLATASLTYEMQKHFDNIGTLDDSRAFPLMPFDIAFTPEPSVLEAFVPANGSDALYRVKFDETYQADAIKGLGWTKQIPFINLGAGANAGQLPIGVALTHKPRPDASAPKYGFVANDASRNVSIIDIDAGKVLGVASSAALPTTDEEKNVLEGRRLFQTGLGRWSLDGQGWVACQSCHVDGLTDGVTWYFSRGPRQSLSLEGTFNKDGDKQRIINWTAPFDEVSDLEQVIRTTMGGVGVIVKNTGLSVDSRIPWDTLGQSGLNGSSDAAADTTNPGKLPDACAVDDWAQVTAYARSIRSPKRPSNLDPAKVQQGKDLFLAARCQGCHGGDMWTVSERFYTPDPTGAVNASLKTKSWLPSAMASGFPASLYPSTTMGAQNMRYSGAASANDQLTCALRPVGTYGVGQDGAIPELKQDMLSASQGADPDGRGFNTPSLLGMSVGAPFFHAGNARSLEGLFSDAFSAHHAALSPGFLDGDPDRAAKVAALVQFLLSLDDAAETVPPTNLGPQGGVLCGKPLGLGAMKLGRLAPVLGMLAPLVAGCGGGDDSTKADGAAPAPIGLGFGISFTQDPHTDNLDCHYIKTKNDSPAEIRRVRVNFPHGSHHVHIYRSSTPEDSDYVKPCTGGVDWNRWKLVVGAQTEPLDWSLPDGVTIPLEPHQQLLVQVHWVNVTDKPVSPDITIDLEEATHSEHHLGVAFGVSRDVRIEPHQKKSTAGFVPIPEGAELVAMMGHFHERGRHYLADLRPFGSQSGMKVYEGQGEQTLTFKRFGAGEVPVMGANQGIAYMCEMENLTQQVVTWGANVANQEHCNIAIYYKLPGLDATNDIFAQGDVAKVVLPTKILAGSTGTGKITLDAPAGPQGIEVFLSTDKSIATVPTMVTVPAWQQSVDFPITGVRPMPKLPIDAGTGAATHGAPVSIDGLRLSEVFYSGSDQWVEVSNVSSVPVNLCDYSLTAGTKAFGEGALPLWKCDGSQGQISMLPPGGCLVVGTAQAGKGGGTWYQDAKFDPPLAIGDSAGGVALVAWPYSDWWSGAGSAVPNILDALVFGSAPAPGLMDMDGMPIAPVSPSGTGQSLERINSWFPQAVKSPGICRVTNALLPRPLRPLLRRPRRCCFVRRLRQQQERGHRIPRRLLRRDPREGVEAELRLRVLPRRQRPRGGARFLHAEFVRLARLGRLVRPHRQDAGRAELARRQLPLLQARREGPLRRQGQDRAVRAVRGTADPHAADAAARREDRRARPRVDRHRRALHRRDEAAGERGRRRRLRRARRPGRGHARASADGVLRQDEDPRRRPREPHRQAHGVGARPRRRAGSGDGVGRQGRRGPHDDLLRHRRGHGHGRSPGPRPGRRDDHRLGGHGHRDGADHRHSLTSTPA